MNAVGATTFACVLSPRRRSQAVADALHDHSEIVKARYGRRCHLLFTFYALVCAHIVTGSLVLGASATFNAMTGANIIATNFLLPAGIAIYVSFEYVPREKPLQCSHSFGPLFRSLLAVFGLRCTSLLQPRLPSSTTDVCY